MNQYTEFTGKTVEEAVEEGLKELGLTRENAEIRILEEGRKKLFGFTKARVEIAPITPDNDEEKGCTDENDQDSDKESTEEKSTRTSEMSEFETQEEKNLDEEEQKINLDKEGRTDGERAVDFIEGLFDILRITATTRLKKEGEKIEINVDAANPVQLTGRRGMMIDCIQTIAGAVANIGRSDYKRVVVDCENYRENREATLQGLAQKLAIKAVRMDRKLSLEPMTPYERRIIHAALSDSKDVTTCSEGKEPRRYVVIVPNNLTDPELPAVPARPERPQGGYQSGYRKPYNRDFGGSQGGYRKPYNRDNNGYQGGYNRPYNRDNTANGASNPQGGYQNNYQSGYRKPYNRDNNGYQGGYRPYNRDNAANGATNPTDSTSAGGAQGGYQSGYRKPYNRDNNGYQGGYNNGYRKPYNRDNNGYQGGYNNGYRKPYNRDDNTANANGVNGAATPTDSASASGAQGGYQNNYQSGYRKPYNRDNNGYRKPYNRDNNGYQGGYNRPYNRDENSANPNGSNSFSGSSMAPSAEKPIDTERKPVSQSYGKKPSSDFFGTYLGNSKDENKE